MSEYNKIVERCTKEGIDLTNKYILVPYCDENQFSVNGDLRFGRVFEDTGLVVILRDVDCQYSPNGWIEEPFVYRIVNKYKTYLANSWGHYLVEFYVIE